MCVRAFVVHACLCTHVHICLMNKDDGLCEFMNFNTKLNKFIGC